MSTPFPAVIKEIRLGVTETVLTLDVSVPDVQTLAGLLDREVSVLITEPQGALPALAHPKPVAPTPAPTAHSTPPLPPAPEKLPFDPDAEDCTPLVNAPPASSLSTILPPASRPRPTRRPSRSRK